MAKLSKSECDTGKDSPPLGRGWEWTTILNRYWGYTDFRGIQREIIESVCSGKDTLGLMPTGGGKSITFQVPTMAMQGLCLVITPLIALMKDQVYALRRNGIVAYAIYSGMSRDEIVATLENCIFGDAKFLYVSPERLSTEIFQNKVRKMNICLITVDEAHCISQWGYDFRPAYLQIAKIRELLAHPSPLYHHPPTQPIPVLALTATATPEVIDDIQEQLHFREKNVFRMSFARDNLAYRVHYTDDKEKELISLLSRNKGCAIVYTRSRARTKEIAEILNKHGIPSTFYHAGLQPAVKDERQEMWQHDKVRVMVATNAFGMGIDKPDVRLVVHTDCPSSLEAYFQEAGRAGRDGRRSWAILLYNNNDNARLKSRIDDTFPPIAPPKDMERDDPDYPKDNIRDIYDHLAYFFQIGINSGEGCTREFNIDKFCTYFHHFPTRVHAALAILQKAGYIEYESDPDTKARVKFLLQRHELYQLRQLPADYEKVITALLRCYGALFVEYVYVDEAFVAKQADMDQHTVYTILKELSRRAIIDFIPRKNIPLITYSQDRIDGCDLIITKEVYDRRKEEFARRIQAVIDYASNDTICRSRQLLRYFGETDTKDCTHCDVCINYQKNLTPEHGLEQTIKKITDLLSDGKKHPIYELHNLGKLSDNEDDNVACDFIDKALKHMQNEEIVYMDGSFIYLNR